MDMHQQFITGTVIGFAIAAPVGPVAIYCVRETLAHGLIRGLAVGVGSAGADAVYACLAVFGVNWIAGYMADHAVAIRLIGAALLCAMGIKTLLARAKQSQQGNEDEMVPALLLGGFFLTLMNPMAFIAFSLALAASGIAEAPMTSRESLILTSSVLLGALAWWGALSGCASLFRHRFEPDHVLWVNRLAGVILVLFALLLVLTILFPGIAPWFGPSHVPPDLRP